MKIIIDMNLSPKWVDFFTSVAIESAHWVNIGNPQAADIEIFEYAILNECVILTADLDFGAILAFTRSNRPSVIQIRLEYPFPHEIGETLLLAIKQFEAYIKEGCLLTLDNSKMRVKILPLK